MDSEALHFVEKTGGNLVVADVEYGGAGSLTGGSKNVLGLVGGADLAKEGLEFNQGFDEHDGGVWKRLVELGSLVRDADVNEGLRLVTQASKLGKSAQHAGAGGRGGTTAPDVETEGIEKTNDEMFGGYVHVQFVRCDLAAATK